MKKILNKNVILVLVFVAIIVGVIIFMTSSKGIQQEEFSNGNYSLTYDTTWKIKSSAENEIKLQHNDTQSTIDISIAELDSTLYGKSLKQIAANIKNKVESEYSGYKCISENEIYLNDNLTDVYQLLFENGKRQSLIQIGMHGYKVFVSNYTAENKYFDILLDSVQTINTSFKITDKTIDMMNTRKIETTGYTVKTDDIDYSEVAEYSYRGSYYNINFAVPVRLKPYSSGSSYFVEEENELTRSSVRISTDSENIYTVYDREMKDIKNMNYYKNIETEKIKNGDYEGYAIKYYSDYSDDITKYENYKFLYVINNYNTLMIDISGTGVTQSLIDNIKILSCERYGTYIDRTVHDGYYKGSLVCEKHTIDGKSTTMRKTLINIDYSIPEKYTEIEEPTGQYGAPEQARAFIIGKLRNSDITESEWNTDLFYDYNVTISIASGNVDYIANNNKLTYKRDVTINGITYKYYTSEYDSEGTTIKEAYYLTDINDSENNKYSYQIYVSSLDEIPESVLQDFTSVNIEVEALE